MSLPDLPIDWRWPNFRPDEFRCKGSGRLVIVPGFMDRLQALRVAYGRPMVITSGYRSPDYNVRVSSTGPGGPHTTGRAVDVAVRGADALELLQLALSHGFTGIGVQQKGQDRFIHLDDLDARTDRPRPWIWSY